jgi:hypothetical protein
MTQSSRPIYKHIPFILLILAQLTFGLLTFRDYGLSWDEPLFYAYGDALGYAYTPSNWFSPDFDLNKAYGPSGDDHKTRGPAYLLLARTPVYLLQALGVDEPSAWHLVNFLTFLLGVYFVYRLSLRWMGEWAAFGAVALFSTQPLLLGHAFINPKDMPFLVFFTGALLFGFEMVDGIFSKTKSVKRKMLGVVVAAFFLGIATSIRVLAPLVGILVAVYFVVGRIGNPPERNTIPLHKKLLWILLYAFITILFMLSSWPYLWESPLKNFFQVFLFMSENPTGLQVLFNGQIYRAFELPRRYLPTLLGITLTEPVWLLFSIGLLIRALNECKLPHGLQNLQVLHRSRETSDSDSNGTLSIDYWLTLTAFLIPFLYVITLQPPMYDGFRHFLFILPPIFITTGFTFQAIINALQKNTNNIQSQKEISRHSLIREIRVKAFSPLLILALLTPNIFAIANLHPFEYTYYNSLVGGTGGAFRTYETDYWLTCYKQAVEQVNALAPANLFVHREAYIATTYAAPGLTVREERGNLTAIQPGDYILVNTRTNEDRKTFRDAPIVSEVGRDGATFCVVKQVP